MSLVSHRRVSVASVLCALMLTGSALAQEAPAPDAEEAFEAVEAPAEAEEVVPEDAAVPASAPPVVVNDFNPVVPLPGNTIYAEGLGAGFLYSFNYERVLPLDFAVRVGFGYLGIGATVTDEETGATAEGNVGFFTVPITASYLGLRSDSGVHIFELGLGVTIAGLTASASADVPLAGSVFAEDSAMTAVPHFVLGYRLQLGFLQLRGGFSPLITVVDGSVGVVPLPHVSMGLSL